MKSLRLKTNRLEAIVLVIAIILCSAPDVSARDVEPLDSVQQAIDDLQQVQGKSWRATLDQCGYVRFLSGSRIAAPEFPGNDSGYLGLANRYLQETEGLFAFRGSHLKAETVRHAHLGMEQTREKVSVAYQQIYRNIPVYGSSVVVMLAQDGSLVAVDSQTFSIPFGFSTRPILDGLEASDAAEKAFFDRFGCEPDTLTEPELVIFPSRTSDCTIPPRLAWKLNVVSGPAVDELSTKPSRNWMYFIAADQDNPYVIHEFNRIKSGTIEGQVRGMVTPGYYYHSSVIAYDGGEIISGPPDLDTPMSYLIVNMKGTYCGSLGNTQADIDGEFEFTGQSSGQTLCFGLRTTNGLASGIRIENKSSSLPELSIEELFSLNTPETVTFNDDQTVPDQDLEYNTAQVNTYHWMNESVDYVKGVDSSFPAISTTLFRGITNDGTIDCNAVYSPDFSVNFSTSGNYPAGLPNAGDPCPNFAFSTIILHEMGHWYNHLADSGILDSAYTPFNEGVADTWVTYQTDQPVLGHGLYYSRTGENDNQFCGDSPQPPSCHGGDSHDEGEVLMGALWKIRKYMKLVYGDTYTISTLDPIFVSWVKQYQQRYIQNVIEEQWLERDDDDDDLFNGTPHYAVIDAGFREQGFSGTEGFLDCYSDSSFAGTELGLTQYPFDTISECLERTISDSSGDTPEIHLADGVYNETPTGGTFTIDKNVTIRGGSGYGAVTIQ